METEMNGLLNPSDHPFQRLTNHVTPALPHPVPTSAAADARKDIPYTSKNRFLSPTDLSVDTTSVDLSLGSNPEQKALQLREIAVGKRWEDWKHFDLFWETLWIFCWALLAANLSFWVPSFYIPNTQINLGNFFQNITGSMIIALCTAFQEVKFQYHQTYLSYNGIKCGFCSVFTSFGNLIEDTGVLLFSDAPWQSIANLALNISVAFLCNALGRLLAIKWKAGTSFSWELFRMETEEYRMNHAVEVEIAQNPEQFAYNLDLDALHEPQETRSSAGTSDSSTTAPHKYALARLSTHFSTKFSFRPRPKTEVSAADVSAALLADDFLSSDNSSQSHSLSLDYVDNARGTIVRPSKLRLAPTFHDAPNASARFAQLVHKHHTVAEIDSHLQTQLTKKSRHTTRLPTARHKGLLVFINVFILLSSVMLYCTYHFKWISYTEFWYSYFMELWLSVSGAFVGTYVGKGNLPHQVQWGTFKVNMISCILIGTALNLLTFRRYLLSLNTIYLTIFLEQFISSFCGSESSFAGFIDETSVLFNSNIPKKVALRNFFYTLVLCLCCFLVLVFFVRYALLSV